MSDTKINNYTNYNAEMDKSILDKLFFLTKLEDIDILIDYGCADGTLLSAVHAINPNIICHGYDINPEMIKLAREKDLTRKISFNTQLPINDGRSPEKKIAVLFSSILHEMYHYDGKDSAFEQFKTLVRTIKPNYIIVRDMISPEYSLHSYGTDLDIMHLRDNMMDILRYKDNDISKALWSLEFDRTYSFDKNQLALALLKYRYFRMGNWEREKYENYFSYEGLRTIVHNFRILSLKPINPIKRYKRIFYNTSRLDYINSQTKKDFGVEYPWDTHWYAIYELIY